MRWIVRCCLQSLTITPSPTGEKPLQQRRRCSLNWPTHFVVVQIIERFSYDLEKWFRWVFIICFISQWMKRSKYGLFVFPPKKTLIWRGHPSIGQWCCSMTSKQSVDWFLESSRAWQVFSPERSLNQSKATSVCIRSTDQSYCSISVRLLFLFCSRVFISRSYENRSIPLFLENENKPFIYFNRNQQANYLRFYAKFWWKHQKSLVFTITVENAKMLKNLHLLPG